MTSPLGGTRLYCCNFCLTEAMHPKTAFLLTEDLMFDAVRCSFVSIPMYCDSCEPAGIVNVITLVPLPRNALNFLIICLARQRSTLKSEDPSVVFASCKSVDIYTQ